MPHIHDAIDFCVEVFIVHDGKVLLRKHDKYGIWLSVGGHIELDEDPVEAAVREVREEVGIEARIVDVSAVGRAPGPGELIPPVGVNRHPIGESHEHVAFIYFATCDDDALSLSGDEVSEECRWWSAEDIASSDELRPGVAHYAREALRRLK